MEEKFKAWRDVNRSDREVIDAKVGDTSAGSHLYSLIWPGCPLVPSAIQRVDFDLKRPEGLSLWMCSSAALSAKHLMEGREGVDRFVLETSFISVNFSTCIPCYMEHVNNLHIERGRTGYVEQNLSWELLYDLHVSFDFFTRENLSSFFHVEAHTCGYLISHCELQWSR